MDGFPRHNRRDRDCKGAQGRGQNGRMDLLLVQTNQDQGGVWRMDIGWEGQHVVRGTRNAMPDARLQIRVGGGHWNHRVGELVNSGVDCPCSFDCR